ncbi:MAG: hypothetical protein ACREF4_21050, partial [Gammaproteobacteria bacterium]
MTRRKAAPYVSYETGFRDKIADRPTSPTLAEADKQAGRSHDEETDLVPGGARLGARNIPRRINDEDDR